MLKIYRRIKAWIADFSISGDENEVFDIVYCGKRRVAAIADECLLQKLALDNSSGAIRLMALRKITDDNLLTSLAIHSNDKRVGAEAVKRIKSNSCLQKVIYDSCYDLIRISAISKLGTGYDKFYKRFVVSKGLQLSQEVLMQIAENILNLKNIFPVCLLLRAFYIDELINFLFRLYTLETLTRVLISPLLEKQDIENNVKKALWKRIDSKDFYLSYQEKDFAYHLLDIKYGSCIYPQDVYMIMKLSISLELPFEKMKSLLKQIHYNPYIEANDIKRFIILNATEQLVDLMLNCSDNRLVNTARHWCNAHGYIVKHHISHSAKYDFLSEERYL